MPTVPVHTLFEPGGPALRLTTINPSHLHDIQIGLSAQFPDAVIRTIRGRQARTMQAFLAHFAVAFQFPYHFNETWTAFEHHTAALYGTEADARPHLLLVSHASELLQDAPPRALGDLLRFLGKLHKTWSQPHSVGEGLPTSFQVLLQEYGAGVQLLRTRLLAAGVLYELWEPESNAASPPAMPTW